jgi:RNA polymerase sigma factor (sigma-70 family)
VKSIWLGKESDEFADSKKRIRTCKLPIVTGIDWNTSGSIGNYLTEESPMALDELSLVCKAQSGDRKAFCVLIRPYLHHIYRTATRITGNHEDAEDASQECLGKAFTHLQSFRKDSRFSTWLTRIAINESLMRVRKRKPQLRNVMWEKDMSEIPSVSRIRDPKDSSDPEAIWAEKERNEILRDDVLRLGMNSKIAIHLFQAGDIKLSEIGYAQRL